MTKKAKTPEEMSDEELKAAFDNVAKQDTELGRYVRLLREQAKRPKTTLGRAAQSPLADPRIKDPRFTNGL